LIEQHYEYIAVVDFEATCNANQGTTFPHEIIEFPIVLIDTKQKTIVCELSGFLFEKIFVLFGSD